MKRELCRNLSTLDGIDVDARSEYIDPKFEYTDSELDGVLKEIFAVDPTTGLPRGDIAYFLSKDGNPQVKAWLESNLLSPRSKQTGTSLDGVTDDFIAEFARNDDESVVDYQARLMSYYDEAKSNLDLLKQE